MASAKRKGRNIKTHPRVRGEDNPDDDFLPPDRPDRIAESESGPGASEVIDFSKTEVVDTAGDEGERPSSQVERRTDAAEPAPPRRQEREDRASRREARGEGESEEDAQDRRSYSARVQKRIARERAVVNRERALREQTQKQLAEERAARQELADRMLKIERSTTKARMTSSARTGTGGGATRKPRPRPSRSTRKSSPTSPMGSSTSRPIRTSTSRSSPSACTRSSPTSKSATSSASRTTSGTRTTEAIAEEHVWPTVISVERVPDRRTVTGPRQEGWGRSASSTPRPSSPARARSCSPRKTSRKCASSSSTPTTPSTRSASPRNAPAPFSPPKHAVRIEEHADARPTQKPPARARRGRPRCPGSP